MRKEPKPEHQQGKEGGSIDQEMQDGGNNNAERKMIKMTKKN